MEAWLRGPIDGVPPLLQPVAHSLVQAREEIRAMLREFPDELLWTGPAGVASVGFHLQHVSGVVDRLFTYARGETLTNEQREALANEGKPNSTASRVADLLEVFDARVDRALSQLRGTPAQVLTEPRGVGRQQLPSTVLGLLFHAAEHVQRHTGQLLVTAQVQLGDRRSMTDDRR